MEGEIDRACSTHGKVRIYTRY